jgi:hypothetical protein
MQMEKSNQSQVAKSQSQSATRLYTEPTLVTYGSVEQLTQHVKPSGSCFPIIKRY